MFDQSTWAGFIAWISLTTVCASRNVSNFQGDLNLALPDWLLQVLQVVVENFLNVTDKRSLKVKLPSKIHGAKNALILSSDVVNLRRIRRVKKGGATMRKMWPVRT